MIRLIIFLAGIMGVFIGINKIRTNYEAFENTVEAAEKSNLADYDYFKLSKGFMFQAYVIYEQNELTKKVTQFVYPFVSKSYIDSLYSVFLDQSPATDVEFMDWFDNLKDKPHIFVQSKYKDISEENLYEICNNDTIEKKIEGTRLLSFVDLSDKIKEKLEETGITPENTLFIEEGSTPSDNKVTGWFSLILGIAIILGSIISYKNKVDNA